MLAASCGRLGFDTTAATTEDAGSIDAAADIDAMILPDAQLGCSPTPFVQRGEVTIEALPSVNVPITPIDSTCSFVLCERRTTSNSPRARAICELSSTSELTIGAGQPNAGTVHWQVVSASRFSVQRGLLDLDGLDATATATLDALDPTRSFALVTSYGNDSGIDADERALFSIEVLDATTVSVRRGETGPTARVAWQVVEVAGATVQTQTVNLGATVLETTATISAIARDRAFVISSRALDPDTDGEEASYQMFVDLLDATSVVVTRRAAEDAQSVVIQVVELPAGTAAASHDTLATIAPHAELVLQTPRAVDPERSFTFSTTTIASGVGRAALSASDVITELEGGMVQVVRDDESGQQLDVRTTTIELLP